ncbi:cobyrinic acid a,c-diamide synthase [Gemmobacter lanyuensis]|uniref:Cobyrinic acid a,c-diamide synthase n=1 Tax=Gemmobacter lanyuensis TaxID=1054497 RepID=A0A918MJL7_9RHOB|nr:ParA family partition ATPase [Gemmobacter lanyuensis]GGW27574.1 cobyrinic acid a,c-diamide synthase [Gemmobacter lanyuensis]
MGKVITIAQQKGGAGKTTLAVTLAGAFVRQGLSVALLDSDPQGSLGRWFMTRVERLGEPDVEFSTASAWGVGYECRKLKGRHDIVIVDTPPKADSDLRPALREADLVLVPVAASHVDLWATDGVLDLVARESGRALIVLNRMSAGTRLAEEVAKAAEGVAQVAKSRLAARVAYAETLGQGASALDARGPAAAEAKALAAEVLAALAE